MKKQYTLSCDSCSQPIPNKNKSTMLCSQCQNMVNVMNHTLNEVFKQ